jgi:hypothetical protein
LVKDVQIWVDQRNVKKHNEKKGFQRIKIQKLGSPKNERAKKT